MSTKIFVSHASANKVFIDYFVEYLQLSFNIDSQEIAYTSLPETGLRNFSNFNNELKVKIQECKLAVIFLTNEYANSQYCMCELGALWVIGKKCFLFNIDNIDKATMPDLVLGTTYSTLNYSALDEFYETLTETAPETKKKLRLTDLNSTKEKKLKAMLNAVEMAKQTKNDSPQQKAPPNSPIDKLDDSNIRHILIILKALSCAALDKITVDDKMLKDVLKSLKWDYTTIQCTIKSCTDNKLIEESDGIYKLTESGCLFYEQKKLMLEQNQQ